MAAIIKTDQLWLDQTTSSTVGAPALIFGADSLSGLYRIGTNNIGLTINGTKLLDLSSATFAVTGAGTFSTTLGVTGTSTLAAVNASGLVAMAGAATVGTTLGVTGATTLSSTLAVTGAITSGLKLSTFNTIDQFAIVANTTWGGANQRVLVGIQKSSVGSGGLGIDASDNVTLFNSAGSGQLTVTSTGATIPGTLGVTGTITPGQTTGIVGTTTNNNVQAGSVGEYIESRVVQGSSVALTTATDTNVTSISITAGDWDVGGLIAFDGNSSTLVQNALGGASTTSATLSGSLDYATLAFNSTGLAVYTTQDPRLTIPTIRFSVSATTTIYLVVRSSFSVSTNTAYGQISARRVR